MKIIDGWRGHQLTMYAYLRNDRENPQYDFNRASRLNNTLFWSIPLNYGLIR